MKLYLTGKVNITELPIIGVVVKVINGPDIIAEDENHAHMILKHLCQSEYSILAWQEIEQIEKHPVVWDSLILPNELQLN